MQLVSDSFGRRGVAVLAMVLVLAGCGGAAATQVVVNATPTPAATSTATPAPAATATPAAAPTATPAATPTPAPAATPTPAPAATPTPAPAATPTPAPAATPTPALTETPAPTPTPAASPTSAAAACTGTTVDLKALFVAAASSLNFDVYCAVLPSNWWLQSASLPGGGYLEAEYKNSGGADFEIREGRWCPPNKVCIAVGPAIGSASFGGLAGTLYFSGSTYTLRVGTSANPAYSMNGFGMSQAQFVAWAAALVKVPKT